MKHSATYFHAVTDYGMSALLLVAPWLFGFSHDGNATSCTMAFGIGIVAYSLFTDYELSLRRVIPMGIHLALDAMAGGLLIAAPFIRGYAHTVWVPHLVLGAIEAAMAAGFTLFLLMSQATGVRTRRPAH